MRAKMIRLPEEVWDEIADYRESQRIVTETEAIRRLIHDALTSRKLLSGLTGDKVS